MGVRLILGAGGVALLIWAFHGGGLVGFALAAVTLCVAVIPRTYTNRP